jgi:hypothetical protein
MTVEIPYVTRYEHRVNLVADALQEHSKLGGKAASEAAVYVLRALDMIPETVR